MEKNQQSKGGILGRETLLGLLKEEQRKHGWISQEAMMEMAASLGIGLGEVYGVASFYSFLSTKPLGRHVIRICKSVPCFLGRAETVAEAIARELGIAPGETTADGRFTFERTNCIGSCDCAPAMLVDDRLYGDLTPEKVGEILRSFD